MKTEIKDGQRVWTKESIEVILDTNKPSRVKYHELKMLLFKGLGEVGFEQPSGVRNKSHFTMTFERKDWVCGVHLVHLEQEDEIAFILGFKMHPVEDLVCLWDLIRASWNNRG